MMESEESKISVWVGREEKLVFGLSKRTTCADLVQVLLEDQNSPHALCVGSQSYCLVEKWRGFERILPNTTKMLRLWFAWGEEQENVKFVLVKSEATLSKPRVRSAEARVVHCKHSPCVAKGTARYPMAGISPEKQRRIVRKAFRKLEKINSKKRSQAAHRDASTAEKMETLAHVVISQDLTIRQQIQRITELDVEIEKCEAKMHLDRIERHGVNYVQDTYLVDVASSRDGDKECSAETFAKLEQYVRQCEEVVELQEDLWKQEALIESIASQVQEELNHRWMQRRNEELRCSSAAPQDAPALPSAEAETASENDLLLEEERIRTQLDASLYIGLRLNADLEAIRSDLELTQEICRVREKEMRDLLEKVNTLDIEEGMVSEEGCCHGPNAKTEMMNILESKSKWVEQARGLSKALSVNDDDSDTGLSSLHSQDSDSHPVWESLV